MSETKDFSERFLDYFPCYSHHAPFHCQNSQRGIFWTPDMKEVILHEVDQLNHTMREISAYLQVHEQRIKNLKKSKKDGDHFSLGRGRPSNSEKQSSVEDRADVISNLKRVTQAQVRERKDLRDMVSTAAANYIFDANKPSHLIGSFLAHEFIVSERNQEIIVPNKENIEALTNIEKSTLDQTIKWFMLCSANGKMAYDVFVIADDSMGAEDCEIYPISGLTHHMYIGTRGYLAVTATRAANSKLLNWYYENIILPFVHSCREYVSPKNLDQPFYLIADGEEIQIRTAHTDNKINNSAGTIRECQASCIDTIGNGCDRCNLFKAANKVVKSVNIEIDENEEDASLNYLIDQTLSKEHPNIDASKSNLLSKGFVRIVRALSSAVNIIAGGFRNVEKRNHEEDVIDSIEMEVGPLTLFERLACHFMNDTNEEVVVEVLDQQGLPLVREEATERRSSEKTGRASSKKLPREGNEELSKKEKRATKRPKVNEKQKLV
eukprot:gene10097-10976_t